MLDDGALGLPGGARRVEDVQLRVTVEFLFRWLALNRWGVENRRKVDDMAIFGTTPGGCEHLVSALPESQDDAGFAVGEDESGACRGGIDLKRNVAGTGLDDAEQAGEQLPARIGQDGDPVAEADVSYPQGAGNTLGEVIELGVADALRPKNERDPARIVGEDLLEPLRQ